MVYTAQLSVEVLSRLVQAVVDGAVASLITANETSVNGTRCPTGRSLVPARIPGRPGTDTGSATREAAAARMADFMRLAAAGFSSSYHARASASSSSASSCQSSRFFLLPAMGSDQHIESLFDFFVRNRPPLFHASRNQLDGPLGSLETVPQHVPQRLLRGAAGSPCKPVQAPLVSLRKCGSCGHDPSPDNRMANDSPAGEGCLTTASLLQSESAPRQTRLSGQQAD